MSRFLINERKYVLLSPVGSFPMILDREWWMTDEEEFESIEMEEFPLELKEQKTIIFDKKEDFTFRRNCISKYSSLFGAEKREIDFCRAYTLKDIAQIVTVEFEYSAKKEIIFFCYYSLETKGSEIKIFYWSSYDPIFRKIGDLEFIAISNSEILVNVSADYDPYFDSKDDSGSFLLDLKKDKEILPLYHFPFNSNVNGWLISFLRKGMSKYLSVMESVVQREMSSHYPHIVVQKDRKTIIVLDSSLTSCPLSIPEEIKVQIINLEEIQNGNTFLEEWYRVLIQMKDRRHAKGGFYRFEEMKIVSYSLIGDATRMEYSLEDDIRKILLRREMRAITKKKKEFKEKNLFSFVLKIL